MLNYNFGAKQVESNFPNNLDFSDLPSSPQKVCIFISVGTTRGNRNIVHFGRTAASSTASRAEQLVPDTESEPREAQSASLCSLPQTQPFL